MANKYLDLTGLEEVVNKIKSKFVAKRDNGYAYSDVASGYSKNGPGYWRIEIPNTLPNYAMIQLDINLTQNYATGHNGKLLIYGYHTNTEPYDWRALNVVKIGYLKKTLSVYGSDGKYFYIGGCDTYTTISVNKILVGDSATSRDLTNVVISKVSELPETYQTASVLAVDAEVEGDLTNKVALTSGNKIPTNADLDADTYKKVGSYYCETNADAASLSNAPSGLDYAFMLHVYSPPDNESRSQDVTGNYLHRLQVLTSYTGHRQWKRSLGTNAQGEWTFSTWKLVYDTDKNRTINVGGQAGGTAQSLDGTGNVVIPVTSLNTQALVRPSCLRGVADNTLRPQINTTRANRLAFLPADQIIIEQTIDGGETWTDAGISDENKKALFSETRPGSVTIPLLNGVKSTLCGLRITITAMKYNVPANTPETEKYNYWNSTYVKSTERYCQLQELYFWLSAVSDSMSIKVERANGATSTTWSSIFSNTSFYMTGWSGSDYVRFSQAQFGGSTGQTGQPWNYRMTIMTRGVNGTDTMASSYASSKQQLLEIRGYGDAVWVVPNNYMANDHLYTFDRLQNATFPASVTATGGFVGDLTGTATRASRDADGRLISSEYLQKAGGTMSGRIFTSFKGSVAIGSYAPPGHDIPTLLEDLRYSSGAMGSFNLETAFTLNGVTVSTGWYTYIYVPHRTGGTNGTASGDNCNYGTLYLTRMNDSSSVDTKMYVIRYSGETITRLVELTNPLKVNGHTVNADVPMGAEFTDTVTTATTTGSGNAVTSITSVNGALTVTKGETFLTSHQDISGKLDKPSGGVVGQVLAKTETGCEWRNDATLTASVVGEVLTLSNSYTGT